MARAIWKGFVNFGLVNIPVELHTGARDHAPRFRLLHRTDLSPINMERVCQHDGKPVAWDDLIKGYEIEPGRFVTVTEDDFRTAALERSRSIDIQAFVPLADIDPRYWSTPYLVAPAKGADHAYALLTTALAKSGRAGIAKYVMRTRQHLAALLVVDDRLVVCTMRFPDELVALPELRSPGKLAPKELALAAQLIEGMADRWNPAEYADDYVPALMKLIESKADGSTAKPKTGRAPAQTKVVDLISRLKESLAQAQGGKTAAKKEAPRARRAAKRGSRARKSRAA